MHSGTPFASSRSGDGAGVTNVTEAKTETENEVVEFVGCGPGAEGCCIHECGEWLAASARARARAAQIFKATQEKKTAKNETQTQI